MANGKMDIVFVAEHSVTNIPMLKIQIRRAVMCAVFRPPGSIIEVSVDDITNEPTGEICCILTYPIDVEKVVNELYVCAHAIANVQMRPEVTRAVGYRSVMRYLCISDGDNDKHSYVTVFTAGDFPRDTKIIPVTLNWMRIKKTFW